MAHSFQSQWDFYYPNKLPISDYLVQDFPQFRFRIHSLPKSKRYADTAAEYALLLDRHNRIITDCFGTDTSIFIVSGHYFTLSRNKKVYDPAFMLKYQFHLEQEINLTQANPEYYDGEDEEHFFRPCTVEVTWQTNQHNELLRKIADDELRAFMISFEQNIIVAPYDGGIDFIIFDEAKRNDLRNKYLDWLSSREDGL